jgi:hypothetical protein
MSAVGVGLGRMSRADGGRLLRLALRLDAAASGALGLLLAGGGSALGDPLGASATVLIAAGVFLIGYAMGRPAHRGSAAARAAAGQVGF